jgi:hypothetical protein
VGGLVWLSPTPGAQAAPGAPAVFAVISDYGMDDANEAAVASLVASWSPAYIITLGDDYVSSAGGTGTGKYDESTGAYYGTWLKDITTTGTRCPVGLASVNSFFPAMGNHDYSDATPAPDTYLAYFNLPGAGFASTSGNERYYDYVDGAIHFFVVDSNTQEPAGTSSTSTQAQWLQAGLAASTSTWNIVYEHHPPYSSAGSNTYMQWPFATWGADVVLSGHQHTYERILRDGIVYFVNGLGGQPRVSFGTTVTGSVVRYNANWGAQKVTVSDTGLTFQFYETGGALIDSYTVAAPASSPNAPTNLAASAFSSSRIDLSWKDNSGDETGFKIERSPNGASWTQIATVGPGSVAGGTITYPNTGLSSGATYWYRVRAYNGAGNSGYSNVATATTQAAPAIHVGDLDGSRTLALLTWTATVTIVVHDAGHNPVAGAVVTGTWSGGASGSASATTNASGAATVSKKSISRLLASVTFTISGVSKSGYAYVATANHDVDGGTNGTKITVKR